MKDPELRPIPSCPGYLAGSDGHIYSTIYRKHRHGGELAPPRRLKAGTRKHGYVTCGVSLDRKSVPRLVHRLVCEAFHGVEPAPRCVVRHLDGDKENNCPENLRWGTHGENAVDRVNHTRAFGEGSPLSKLSDHEVAAIRAVAPFLPQPRIATMFGITQSHVSRILTKRARRR